MNPWDAPDLDGLKATPRIPQRGSQVSVRTPEPARGAAVPPQRPRLPAPDPSPFDTPVPLAMHLVRAGAVDADGRVQLVDGPPPRVEQRRPVERPVFDDDFGPAPTHPPAAEEPTAPIAPIAPTPAPSERRGLRIPLLVALVLALAAFLCGMALMALVAVVL